MASNNITCRKIGCRETFTSYVQRIHHEKVCEKPRTGKISTVVMTSDKTFLCTKCNGKITQRNNIKRHEKTCKGQTQVQHICNYCKKVFLYSSKLQRHVNQVHNILSLDTTDDCTREDFDFFTPSFIDFSAGASTDTNLFMAADSPSSLVPDSPSFVVPEYAFSVVPGSTFTVVHESTFSVDPESNFSVDPESPYMVPDIHTSTVSDSPLSLVTDTTDTMIREGNAKSYIETPDAARKRVERNVTKIQNT